MGSEVLTTDSSVVVEDVVILRLRLDANLTVQNWEERITTGSSFTVEDVVIFKMGLDLKSGNEN